ncbi:MAG: acyltransferase [Gammaproteobacteria bacterium]
MKPVLAGAVGMPGHFHSLDSLRGLAALLVAVYHAHWVNAFHDLRFVQNAPLMVDVFFVLSGFVICYSYGSRLDSGLAYLRFMWARFGRVYPLHLAMLLVFGLFELSRLYRGLQPTHGDSIHSFVSNLFLVHSLGLHTSLSFNFPSWSVSVEFYTYALFGVVVLLAGVGKWRVATSAVLVTAGLLVLVWLARMPTEHAGHDLGIFRCIAGFFTGVLTYHAYLALRQKAWARGSVGRLVTLGAFVGFGVFESLRRPETLHGYLLLPLVALLILGLTLTTSSRLSAVLTVKPLVWLGKVSYSIYMVHAAVLILATRFIKSVLHPDIVRLPGADYTTLMTTPLQGTLVLLGYLAGLLVVSQVTYSFIEEPFRLRSKRAAERRLVARPQPPVTSPNEA